MYQLEAMLQEKNQKDENWKERKTAERKEVNEWSDRAILTATGSPEIYQQYLDVQADNPRYSATNVLLAIYQNPEVSVINSLKGWNAVGRSVKKDQIGMKVRVSDTYVKDGKKRYGYKIGAAFDISQTSGKGPLPKLILREDSPELTTAIRKLLDISPVKIVTDTTMRGDAFYEPKDHEIHISSELSDQCTFYALTREIVHATIHDHGKYSYYNRTECSFDADCVSYMVCRSLGIDAKKPDTTRVPALYDEMSPQDRRSVLDSIQKIFRKMQSEIQREVAPHQKAPEYTQAR